jgi:hypothetical protein
MASLEEFPPIFTTEPAKTCVQALKVTPAQYCTEGADIRTRAIKLAAQAYQRNEYTANALSWSNLRFSSPVIWNRQA